MSRTLYALLCTLALVGCAPSTTQSPETAAATATETQMTDAPTTTLAGADWLLQQIDGADLDPDLLAAIAEPISLRIDDQHMDGGAAKLSGFDGCNRYFAELEISGERLQIGPIGASKMYCQASSDFAQRYHQQLRQVLRYALDGDALLLLDDSDQPLLRYRLR